MWYNLEAIQADISTEDQHEIEVYFNEITETLDCVDNIRVADPNNPTHMDRYETQAGNGCCGSVEKELTCSSGRRYLIGCNYGH